MIVRIVSFLALCLGIVGPALAENMRMAVTTSFHNSGLSDVLSAALEQELGLRLDLLIVGTGQALRLGKAGDVDAILVHSRAAEEAFVAAGHSTHRREIMYNDFVIIGPRDDPAELEWAQSATEALTKIAAAGVAFVSRGDDSGTHKKEIRLWQQTGLGMVHNRSWYLSVGAGMGAALNTASGMDAYILSDRASWLNFRNKGNLKLLFSGDSLLFNQYAYLPVNPEVHGDYIKSSAAKAVENWLTSDRAKKLINGHQVDGQQLFYFNAK